MSGPAMATSARPVAGQVADRDRVAHPPIRLAREAEHRSVTAVAAQVGGEQLGGRRAGRTDQQVGTCPS